MPRVKGGVVANKKREKLLRYVKGFRWGRKNKKRLAKEALTHAWTHMFHGRKEKKRNFRALWTVKINAAIRPEGMNYSQFINKLKTKKVLVDRKILADLAENDPSVFKAVVDFVKK